MGLVAQGQRHVDSFSFRTPGIQSGPQTARKTDCPCLSVRIQMSRVDLLGHVLPARVRGTEGGAPGPDMPRIAVTASARRPVAHAATSFAERDLQSVRCW